MNRSDDDEWFADVCRSLGREPPSSWSYGRGEPPKVVSAGIISKPRLMLVTVRFGGRSGPEVVTAASECFEIADRSARAVQRLSREVSSFVSRQGIEAIYLRAHGESGKYPGHPLNFKLETVLQLMPKLSVTFVNSASISAWVNRTDPRLPIVPDPLPDAYWRKKQELALEAALWVPEYYHQAKYFWDGSSRDG